MKILKIAVLVVGSLLLLTGLLWIGQGTGYFPYPRTSIMISQTPWAYRGIGLVLVGVAAIALSRRL